MSSFSWQQPGPITLASDTSKDHQAKTASDFGYQVSGSSLRLRRWPHSVISQATRAARVTACSYGCGHPGFLS